MEPLRRGARAVKVLSFCHLTAEAGNAEHLIIITGSVEIPISETKYSAASSSHAINVRRCLFRLKWPILHLIRIARREVFDVLLARHRFRRVIFENQQIFFVSQKVFFENQQMFSENQKVFSENRNVFFVSQLVKHENRKVFFVFQLVKHENQKVFFVFQFAKHENRKVFFVFQFAKHENQKAIVSRVKSTRKVQQRPRLLAWRTNKLKE